VTDGRGHRLISRFADIRPDETRAALYLFLYFFTVTFSIYIIKPVKENYLIGVTPAWWPYADLITAVLIGFVIAFNVRLLNRLQRRVYSTATLAFFVFSLVIFWFIFDTAQKSLALSPTLDSFGLFGIIPVLTAITNSWPVPVIAFSLWADIFVAMSVTQFWIAVNDVFNPYQAKRTIGFFVTGGLAGGIGASLLTSLLVHALGPANLLLVCPAVLVMTMLAVNLVYGEQRRMQQEGELAGQLMAGARVGYLESLRTVRGSRYLRILAGVLACAIIVGTLINYQFKIVLKAAMPDATVRTSFLGSFFLAVLVLSLVFHLMTTGRVLKRFGIRMALLTAPAVLLAVSFSVFFLPVAALTAWACLIRGGDKTFDSTISQSVRELLYIPVQAEIKYKAKIFIDMFVNKFATGLGAALFLVLYHASSMAYKPPVVQVREVGLLVFGFGAAWGGLIWLIYAEYLGIVKKDLSRHWQEGRRVVDANVDIDATRLVFDTLQSREKSSALYAMNLFQLVRKGELTPELVSIINLKEDELTARSMDAVLDVGGEVFYQGAEETMADKDFEVQVREILALDAYKTVMGRHLKNLAEERPKSEAERMEAAKLMGLMEPSPDVFSYLGRLLQDPSPDVLNYALASAAVHLRREHLPLVIRLLGNPMTEQVAQDALAAYGPKIEDVLRKHLQDAREKPAVRRAIPEVLARFANARAVEILTAELARRKEDIEQEVVDALYKIRQDQPDLRFKEKRIKAAVMSLARRCGALIITRAAGGPEAGTDIEEAQALMDRWIKRIFDLLTLIYPAEDIVKAYQNILQGTSKSVDYSLELLDNILPRDLNVLLFPLIEDLPAEEKARRLKKARRRPAARARREKLKKGRGVV